MHFFRQRTKSVTVDDWLGFCEIPAAESLYSDGDSDSLFAGRLSARAGEDGNERNIESECLSLIHAAYVSPAGSLISVKYSAGPDSGFVVENADELAAAVEKATYEEEPETYAARDDSNPFFQIITRFH